MASTFRNCIGHVVNGTWHIRKRALLAAGSAGFVRKLCQQSDLEVVKVLVVSGQLPNTAIFQFGFNDKPILFLGKTVSRNFG